MFAIAYVFQKERDTKLIYLKFNICLKRCMRNLTLKVDEKSCNPTFYRVVSLARRARPDCFVLGFFQFRTPEFFSSSPGACYQAVFLTEASYLVGYLGCFSRITFCLQYSVAQYIYMVSDFIYSVSVSSFEIRTVNRHRRTMVLW